MYIELTARIERPGQVTAVIVERVRAVKATNDHHYQSITGLNDLFNRTYKAVHNEILTSEPYQMTLEDYTV